MNKRPLNIDPVTVVNVRTLPDGKVEALLDVSERDYQRLFDDHDAMSYSLPANPQASVREQFYEALDQATEQQASAHYLVRADGTVKTLVEPGSTPGRAASHENANLPYSIGGDVGDAEPGHVREHVQNWFNREGRARTVGINIPALHSLLFEEEEQ